MTILVGPPTIAAWAVARCAGQPKRSTRPHGGHEGGSTMHAKFGRWAAGVLAAAVGWALSVGTAASQEPTSIKVGWAISKTGPYVGGATITLLNAYKLWVKDVNAAGGITVKGKKLPVEVVEYDDRSNSDELVKALERLITQDKVDLILPSWG